MTLVRKEPMPDIAATQGKNAAVAIDWVGMEKIEYPIRLFDDKKNMLTVLACFDAFVNLVDEMAKGIHMSRLYLAIKKHAKNVLFTPQVVKQILAEFIESHNTLSNKAYLQVSFALPIKRSALLSNNSGFKGYPVTLMTQYDNNKFTVDVCTQVVYSSTCPCSGALARQLIQQHFKNTFIEQEMISTAQLFEWLGKEENILATPHSQRSLLQAIVDASQWDDFDIVLIINALENNLKTAVQTAVKREDEQQFALLNGQNPMFCEDAIRRAYQALDEVDIIDSFWLKAIHQESLHAHDAVSLITKGQRYDSNPNLFPIS